MTLKLYKYVSMGAAKAILGGSKVGFSKPMYFNDPFDHPTAIPVPAGDPLNKLFAGVSASAKTFTWGANTAILSLTRTATSPLMWAHYGDSHQGAVIEFDAVQAGFTDHNANMIPAHFGSVIYVRRFNGGPYHSAFDEAVSVGDTHHFVLNHYEKWQRLFLTKPLDWAYEEEVRVVKCVKGVKGEACETQSGVFSVLKPSQHPIHALHLAPAAISGVTIGLRATDEDVAELRSLRPDIRYTAARLDGPSYAVALEDL